MEYNSTAGQTRILKEGHRHIWDEAVLRNCRNKPGTGTVCLFNNSLNSTLSLGRSVDSSRAFPFSGLCYLYPDSYPTLPFGRCSGIAAFRRRPIIPHGHLYDFLQTLAGVDSQRSHSFDHGL